MCMLPLSKVTVGFDMFEKFDPILTVEWAQPPSIDIAPTVNFKKSLLV